MSSLNLNGNRLNWFNFEVQPNEREDQALEILDEVVEESQSFGIL